MNLFGIKKRKALEKANEEKTLEKVKEEYQILKKRAEDIKKRKALEKANEEKTLEKVKEEYQILKKRAEDISAKERESSHKRETDKNNKCPKCNSTNVNDRIQRIQGEFSGSISGFGNLFGAGLYGSSHGSIDTNEVNKCNDCGHEWKKYKATYLCSSELTQVNFQRLVWALEDYEKAITSVIDKNNLNETFKSDEEKRNFLLEKLKNSYRLKDIIPFFEGISIEAIKEIAIKEVWKASYNDFYIEQINKYWNEKFMEDCMNLKHINIA